MNVSLYQAAAALNANSRWQEVIAENLASSSLPGFKKQELSFAAVQAGLLPAGAGRGPQGSAQFALPATSVATNFRPGEMKFTGVKTDVAIEGPAFLEVQLPSGATGYTRDGELRINGQGELVTKQGHAVLGTAGRLQMDQKNAAPLSISATGEVSQGVNILGKIKLVAFSQPQLLQPAGGGLYLASHPNLQSGDSPDATLRQGFLEGANTSPVTEMANLMTALRAFEASQKLVQLNDERMGRAISELGNPL